MHMRRLESEKELAILDSRVDFVDQGDPFRHLGQELKSLRDGLSELTKSWLSQRNDEQYLVEPFSWKAGKPFSWKTVWFTSGNALQYLSDKDPAWYEVKCDLAAWGNGRFHTALTLDRIMGHIREDKEAYFETNQVLAAGFQWILVYAGM